MSSDNLAQLLYLTLLVGVIGGSFLLSNRLNLGQTLRQAMLWGLIFLGVIAAYGLWNDIEQELVPRQVVFAEEARVEVPRSRDGHYYMVLEANGTPVEFVVDTGATDIVLSRQDAAKIGIDLDGLVYTGLANTANGTVRSAPVRLDTLNLDGIVDRGVRAWVNEGEMFGSLLGMAYLERYERIEIAGDRLVLER
jgi:aspartyl protease family protein